MGGPFWILTVHGLLGTLPLDIDEWKGTCLGVVGGPTSCSLDGPHVREALDGGPHLVEPGCPVWFPLFFLFFLLLAFSPVHISLGNIRRALGR